ncbi:MAG TPA: MFS transporter, partial [Stellaceae bacterium]|nr:MFS transporter [Stellaceae bacterium]
MTFNISGSMKQGARRRLGERKLAASLAVYRQPRLVAILLMGFSSGLPLALTFGTLSYWLAEVGVSLTAIGLFGLVRTSYSLKFLWSPLIDRLPIPILTAWLGRRRSWALLIQALLMAAILALGMTDPRADPAATAFAAVAVAFLSASQDIVIDAYRIDLLRPEEQGAGAAATQWGYRFGMLASGAGALYAAAFGGWHFAYGLMAALMSVGMITVWLTPEPATPAMPVGAAASPGGFGQWLREAVVLPFADLMSRPRWLPILVFVVLYKLGEAMAGSMANPLYQQLGFTKIEVASIA